MFYRAAFPIVSQASVAASGDKDLSRKSASCRTGASIIHHPRSYQAFRLRTPPDDCPVDFKYRVDQSSNSIFPLVTATVRRFLFSLIGDRGSQWPPSNFRSSTEWINDVSVPILPKTRASTVVMSRLHLPMASVRVVVLGPQYMKALALLSDLATPDTFSESSWPATETSFELTDPSMTEWDIPT